MRWAVVILALLPAACNVASGSADGGSESDAPNDSNSGSGLGDSGGEMPTDGAIDGGTANDIGPACIDAGAPFPCDLCAVVDPEEYAILSAALEKHLSADIEFSKPILIRSRTYNAGLDYVVRDNSEAEASTIADLRNKNANGREYCLEGDFSVNGGYQYVDASAFEKLQRDIQQRDAGTDRPEAAWWLGRVGFSSDRTEALAYVAYTCGSLCGTGVLYLLQKSGGSWAVVKGLAQWMS
jgi:hypothetical protein